MKDAFGGAFIIRIMLVFFVIFISFMTVAINWAKAFRIKSGVISILERGGTSTNPDVLSREVKEYLDSINYKYSGDSLNRVISDCNSRINEVSRGASIVSYAASFGAVVSNGGGTGGYDAGPICIFPVGEDGDYYYRVTSYYVFTVPLFGISMTVPISGESKTITKRFY